MKLNPLNPYGPKAHMMQSYEDIKGYCMMSSAPLTRRSACSRKGHGDVNFGSYERHSSPEGRRTTTDWRFLQL